MCCEYVASCKNDRGVPSFINVIKSYENSRMCNLLGSATIDIPTIEQNTGAGILNTDLSI